MPEIVSSTRAVNNPSTVVSGLYVMSQIRPIIGRMANKLATPISISPFERDLDRNASSNQYVQSVDFSRLDFLTEYCYERLELDSFDRAARVASLG